MSYKPLKNYYYSDKKEFDRVYQLRYQSECSVRLDFPVGGHPAFFLQNNDVVSLISNILRLDKTIALLCKKLPGKALNQYAKKCLIDEIVITNNIEGVHSSRKEIGEALSVLEEQSEHKGKRVKFLGIVNKYYKLTKKETIDLFTCQDIRSLYDDLVLTEVLSEDPDNMPDGQIFRKELTEVVSPTGKSIHKGLSPEAEIITATEKALRFLHGDSVIALCRICLFHYLLEYIHPFYDGNGRLGRFILSYCISETLEPLSALRISGTIKENINKYYKSFAACNDPKNMADLTPFLISMLELIEKTEEELVESLNGKLEAWGKYESVITSFFAPKTETDRHLLSVLIQASLFSEQGIPTKELLSILNTTYTTLGKKLYMLREEKILSESKRGNEKYYEIDLSSLDALTSQAE